MYLAGKVSILFISFGLYLRGSTIALNRLAKEFKKREYDVHVLSQNDGPLRKDYESNEVSVTVTDLNPRNTADLIKPFNFIIMNSDLKLISLIPSIVHAGKPIIVIIHNFSSPWLFAELPTFTRADKVVFVSNAAREKFALQGMGKNYVTIHNGLDVSQVESFKSSNSKMQLRKRYNFPDDEIIVVSVGALHPDKGQEVFIKAAISVLRENPQRKMRFLCVGAAKQQTKEGNDYYESITKLIAESGFSSQIIIVSSTDKIFDYYMMADLFVCPSFVESFPLAVLEAMAFKLPIVSTNVGGIPELIENHKQGILIPRKNPEILTKKIEFMLRNHKIALRMAEAAYNRCISEFNIEDVVQQYEKLLLQIQQK